VLNIKTAPILSNLKANAMKYIVELPGNRFELILPQDGRSGLAEVNGKSVAFDLLSGRPGLPDSLLVDGRSFAVEVESTVEGRIVRLDGVEFLLQVTDERREAIAKLTGATRKTSSMTGEVRAPMPGLIVKIDVSVGETVSKGQGVAVVEAMKMENVIRTLSAGTVAKIHVQSGQAVEKGEPLLTIHPQ
jgi:biotin carboxyl carrier protein